MILCGDEKERKTEAIDCGDYGLQDGGGGVYSFVACVRHWIIDHASLSRRSTVPTPNRETSNIWAIISFFPHVAYNFFAYLIPLLFRRL